MLLRKKIKNDLKQFGIYNTILHVIFSLIRPIYKRHCAIIFMKDVDCEGIFFQDCINLDISCLNNFDNVSEAEKHDFSNFLSVGEHGIAIVKNRLLCGSAWIQENGVYKFGKIGRMRIPPNTVIFKNLFVKPEFRGKGIAGKLDRARLAIASKKRAITFIIPENRYAIRNWIKFGMSPILKIKLSQFFRSTWKLECTPIGEHLICEEFCKSIYIASNENE